MIHPIKIFDGKGKLKKTIGAKEALREYWVDKDLITRDKNGERVEKYIYQIDAQLQNRFWRQDSRNVPKPKVWEYRGSEAIGKKKRKKIKAKYTIICTRCGKQAKMKSRNALYCTRDCQLASSTKKYNESKKMGRKISRIKRAIKFYFAIISNASLSQTERSQYV